MRKCLGCIIIKESETMLISEVFCMRYIRVPKDTAAEIAYDHGEQTAEQVVELKISENDFLRLWELGIFNDINNACDSLIDDYEDEVLKGIQLPKTVEVLDRYLSDSDDRIIQRIKEMVLQAIEYGTCVGFDF